MTEFEQIERDCDYRTKLVIAGWVFKHVLAHAREGGSFRGLIHERLGFGVDAYAYLHECGGLEISNEFDIARATEVRRIVKAQKIEALKHVLRFCDEAGCFEDGNCGTPTKAGYRQTCSNHRPAPDRGQ
jgi:hypothetical protein